MTSDQRTPRLRPTTTTFSTADTRTLAAFYERLLGWERGADEPGWITLRPPGDASAHAIAFHHDAAFRRPVWPSNRDAQQIQAHLEIATADLEAAVAHAVECGAEIAGTQPQDDVRVMLDPDGHPFCLYREPST